MIPESSTILDSAAVALIASYLLQTLKASQHAALKWIAKDRPGVLRSLSALLAALAAAGISWQWVPDTGTLTVSGITASGVAGFLWTWGKQYLLQDFAFRLGFKPFQTVPSSSVPPST
jgi:hypothetical protein